MNWLPLDRGLVCYVDDPALYHERVVLRCYGADQVLVVTPDRETFRTELVVGETYSDIKRISSTRLPGGLSENDTYMAKHSGDGNFSREELLQMVQEAETPPGPRRRIAGKLGADGLRHPAPSAGVVPRGTRLVCFSSSGHDVGEQVIPPEGVMAQKVGGNMYKLYSRGGSVWLAQGVSAEDASTIGASLKRKPEGETEERAKDVRLLEVLFDSSEERWRTLSEAVIEYQEVEFEDYPLAGPRTLLRDARQLRRNGMDFIQHHESWLRKSGVRSSDRSVHEHAALCRALNYLACYDQLNIPALAGAECLNRRRSLIEMAHQGRPEAPSYECVDDVLGYKEAADGSVIDPSLVQHAAKRQAAKAEILKQTRLAAEEKRHLHRKGEDDPDKPPKGWGRGGKNQNQGAP